VVAAVGHIQIPRIQIKIMAKAAVAAAVVELARVTVLLDLAARETRRLHLHLKETMAAIVHLVVQPSEVEAVAAQAQLVMREPPLLVVMVALALFHQFLALA
jgi:hypothetical protein